MTRPIQLTLQLTLNVAAETSREELTRDVADQLRQGFGDSLAESPEAIQWIAIRDPDQTLCQLPHLDSVLTNFGIAAAVWCVEDVLELDRT